MTRDFSKDLTIMVAGSGNITMAHLEESMAEWIFGPVEEREVHVILPIFKEMGPGIRNLIKLGMEWEFKFTVIQAKDAPMTRELSALPEDSFVRKDDEREALEHGLSLLTEKHKSGDETAFIMAYNPASTYEQGNPNLSDYEILGEAKNYQWLSTLNLCESLVDSFEGFMTTDEILKAERLQKEFEDKQRAEEAAKPAPAKKAPAPRKRAAKKVEKEETTELPVVAEKPLQDVSTRNSAGQTEEEFNKQANADLQAVMDAVNAGEGPILPGHPDYAKVLVGPDPRNELSADVPIVIGTPDIQEDINAAHAQIEKTHTIVVSKIDLAQLSTDIKELTAAFGNIMDTFTRILKDG